MTDTRAELGLRPIINVSGTMTSLGASIVVPEAIRAVAGILPQFVEINDLQRRASRAIAAACGSQAGFVTASAASGISLAIAGCMTGADLARVERLPDTTGMRDEVPIQLGHWVGYGAPIEQAIRLTGAKPVGVGQATDVRPYQLEGALNDRTAAVLFVVSHHTVQTGQLTLEEVAEIAHARGVPVVVDGASEYDLKGFLARGADVAVYSAHKFLGGPTAGIVAGRKDLVRAAFLQNGGIGRGMKVGKEGVAGAIAALETWARRDHDAVRAREAGYLQYWRERLSRWPGVAPKVSPDPTHNPLDRLEVHIDPLEARITAWDLADALAGGDPPVIVRDHEVELGFFFLDPCNLHPGEERIVADRFDQELERARGANAPAATLLADRRRRQSERLLRWPD
ncbi:MAG: aminotransferase class V-fold PLP-dependent enzyme [Acetobacteraceae bacterium]|nr:aminotransferase class V-fold PLP-dependent enzyme [Acetobacteraceae bacterium]